MRLHVSLERGVTIALTSLAVCSAQARAQAHDSADVATTVRQREAAWWNALTRSDTATLADIVSPQFALVSAHDPARLAPRAAWPGTPPTLGAATFAPTHMLVRVFARRPPWHRWPDEAIASYATGTSAVVTDVWRLDGSRWRAVARYVAPTVAEPTHGAR